MQKDETTEKKILDAARKVFHQKGYEGASMKAIADEAGFTKALVHYYFRKKENLFDRVFQETLESFVPQVIHLIGSELPFEEKIRAIVDIYITSLQKNPHLPTFIFHAVQSDIDTIINKFVKNQSAAPSLEMMKFLKQLQGEVMTGNIKAVDPRHIIINLIAMTVFPFMMKPVMVNLFQMDEASFKRFVEERRDLVPAFLLNGLKPEA